MENDFELLGQQADGAIAKINEEKLQEMHLDSLADFHARLSKCESHDVILSRRITALEAPCGHVDDDPTKMIVKAMIWAMVLQFAVPLVIDLIASWHGKKEA